MSDTAVTKAARMLNRRGASKGGKARFAKLTAAQRTAIARKAAQARWQTVSDEQPAPQKGRMEPEVFGELEVIPGDDGLRFTILTQEPVTRLSRAWVCALIVYAQRWLAAEKR